MKKYNTHVWQNKKTLQYLIFSESSAHVGTKININHTFDINKATKMQGFPRGKEIKREDYRWAKLEITEAFDVVEVEQS